tara:strand:+ start:489 stop:704 length:216 start_codon:yes stop_codon:yes gene_type:complete
MYKTPYQTSNSKKIFLNGSNNPNNTSSSKKVDINILLNKVKINKNNEKKRNLIFFTSIFLSLGFSAFVIFN